MVLHEYSNNGVKRGHLVHRKVSFRDDQPPICFRCHKTDIQEPMLSCHTASCNIAAHVSCYFMPGSEQEQDCLGDMADWFCHECGCQIPAIAAAGGLADDRTPAGPRGDTHLNSLKGTPPAPSLGGWGGTLSTMPKMPLPAGTSKQVLAPATDAAFLNDVQPPASKRHAGPRHDGDGFKGKQGGGEVPGAEHGRQTDLIGAVHCHFCGRTDLWPCLTCGVCQLTTHVKCYYRLGSDEAAHYETHSSDWRCQDCSGPQRHADCVLSNDGQMIQRHAGPRPSNSGYPASGDGGVAAGAPSIPDRSLLAHDMVSLFGGFECTSASCSLSTCRIIATRRNYRFRSKDGSFSSNVQS